MGGKSTERGANAPQLSRFELLKSDYFGYLYGFLNVQDKITKPYRRDWGKKCSWAPKLKLLGLSMCRSICHYIYMYRISYKPIKKLNKQDVGILLMFCVLLMFQELIDN